MAGLLLRGPSIGQFAYLSTQEGSAGLLFMIASMLIKLRMISNYLASIDQKYCQDKKDDVTVGIRSTALLFGAQTRPILSGLSLSAVSLISYAGYLNMHGAPFYCGITLASIQLVRVLYKTDFDSRSSCWRGFVGCGWAGFWIWMGALADYTFLLPAMF